MQLIDTRPLSDGELRGLDAYWRAANYLSVGQIYLLANPLLAEPLRPEHIKPRLLGHWGTTPGLNLIYTHLNRVIRQREHEFMYVIGPGHGGPAIVANSWLEGSWTATYPNTGQDLAGLTKLFRQFSFPGGIPSHVAPEVPGSINEGGELGYSLSHAYGAAFDNPRLVVACVVGDGEAETGPLATSWHSNKFLDPRRDGAVLPILHLNGYKIANPSILARIGDDELTALLEGYGHEPYLVEGSEPEAVHQALAAAMDRCLDRIDDIQRDARTTTADAPRAAWPMIVLKTPKGWTGPRTVDGLPVEDTWRSHQVPLSGVRTNEDHLRQLEDWLRSYRPEELFEETGRPVSSVLRLAPQAERRMGSSPHANGGLITRELELPAIAEYAVEVKAPGAEDGEPTKVLGEFLRDVFTANETHRNFRMVGPDETESNRLSAVYDVTAKAWNADRRDTDLNLATDGRVLEMLSEHTCQGWLEGYLLTGRHGLFSSYEAFVHIVDSMVNQHAKWLKTVNRLDWRRPIPSLNYLLTSHVWRQDHNGFSHQDPGFIDHVVNKKAEVVRVYLPPDTNTLLSTMDHCLRTRNYINVVVAGKQPQPNWLDWEAAALHCANGIGVWDFASNDDGDPDVVMACAGDVPTLETMAAVDLLREHLPQLKIRVVNVVDLMRLQDATEHPHGLTDPDFDALFPPGTPVIFAYHGYPWLIHRLTYRRNNHQDLHVRGFIEEGTTTTPFDMVVRNNLDRYHLAMDVIDRVPSLGSHAVSKRQWFADQRTRHHSYVTTYGEDMPEVRDWRWSR
ncbi:MAG: xylulose-5-phosphate/fructose-6-phosphate phosphoketolase [Kribbellaceae bacterium]|nr:xylulose-5-phosphate/fructose-6-phosphate phosphoketolase [Kribbellaceae bacterium]